MADLQKSNVVRDVQGTIRVIDADCKLHTKDSGGDYNYLPVEHDLPTKEEESAVDDTTLFRDPEEGEEDFGDVWKDRSMGMQERITAAMLKMASGNEASRELKLNARNQIAGNLSDLNKAMGAQRQCHTSVYGMQWTT